MATTEQEMQTARIKAEIPRVLRRTHLRIGKLYVGKVRDVYELPQHLVLVTTDRLSAFDRLLACVPFKGMVLNLISEWWFRATAHIVPSHVVAVPHPNVTIARKCKPFKVEIVVRAFLTGSTSTSIWMHYKAGARMYCGHSLPDGMCKNQKLPYVMVTPTTKSDEHDAPISGADVAASGLMTPVEWSYVHDKALELFNFGVEEAAKRGLILVDTKYEFGKDADGSIRVIDEIHTPDSSRYWLAHSYAERMAAGKEPENIDKEFLRIWFRDNCDPYADAVLPDAPEHLVMELSRRYIRLYEMITGQAFPFPSDSTPTVDTHRTLEAAVHKLVHPAKLDVALVASPGDEQAARAADALADQLVFPRPHSGAATPHAGDGTIPGTEVSSELIKLDWAAAPMDAVHACHEIRDSPGASFVVVFPRAGGADHLSRLFGLQTRSPVLRIAAAEPPSADLAGAPVATLADASAAVAFIRRILRS